MLKVWSVTYNWGRPGRPRRWYDLEFVTAAEVDIIQAGRLVREYLDESVGEIIVTPRETARIVSRGTPVKSWRRAEDRERARAREREEREGA